MPNTIKTISLTDDDKSYLNKLLTQSTLEIRVYQRARILLLKSEGASNKAIADKKLSCRRKGTVRKVCFDISEYGINLIHRGVIQNHTVLEQIDHLAGNQRKKTV